MNYETMQVLTLSQVSLTHLWGRVELIHCQSIPAAVLSLEQEIPIITTYNAHFITLNITLRTSSSHSQV